MLLCLRSVLLTVHFRLCWILVVLIQAWGRLRTIYCVRWLRRLTSRSRVSCWRLPVPISHSQCRNRLLMIAKIMHCCDLVIFFLWNFAITSASTISDVSIRWHLHSARRHYLVVPRRSLSSYIGVGHLLLPAQLPGTHWVMICVIRPLVLTVSDVCLQLGCFQRTST